MHVHVYACVWINMSTVSEVHILFITYKYTYDTAQLKLDARF